MRSKLGVIGGMGPEATSYFYEEVIVHTNAACDQEHIDMVILSHATMPDRTRAILTGREDALLQAMEHDVKLLEACGVANIAIPCNTSHYFYDKIQAQTNIPIIHMIRESVAYAIRKRENVRRIGILGTDGTIRSGIYKKECEAAGVQAVVPGPEGQKAIMSMIYDDIKGGNPGNPEKFECAMADLMAQGCDVVLLACTEISVFKRGYWVPECCLDAMDVLVRESILRSGAEYID